MSQSNNKSHFWLGVDGGGTNCRASIIGAAAEVTGARGEVLGARDEVLGEGCADAANHIRVGIETAVDHVREAVTKACLQAAIELPEITAACIGLAGVSHPDHHRQVLEAIKEVLPISEIALETDARVALAGATGNKAGVVIIAGTGSIACGINSRGRFARAGGWGPTMGDEGSGSYIGRRALESVMMSYDYRGEPTIMMEPILRHFGVSSPPELPPVIYDDPDRAMREIAQLSKLAVAAAREGDNVAREILKDAAKELAVATIAVIDQLRMERDEFQVAFVGGVFEARELILDPLREEIQRFAPHATVSPPIYPPVIGAARMAKSLSAGRIQ